MKVLWIVNIILPQIAEKIDAEPVFGGGWIVGLEACLRERKDIELLICFPYKTIISINIDGVKCYSFYQKNSYKYSRKTVERLESIIANESPDIIHVFGTEFPHSLATLIAAQNLDLINRTVVSIQGLVSVYAKHYFAGLPNHVVHKFTIRDFLKRDT